jgi:UDP-GlcNAc:undecaprenyl-phosphate/decaprenyl-phosphate GlcNAc-1-phosphate transferase
MRKWRIVDIPKTEKRKIHKKKTPLGGGIALFFSFFFCTAVAVYNGFVGEQISVKILLLVFIAGFVLMVGGLIDDAKTLRPWQQIWFPVVAAGVVAFSGIGPSEITNPFGGTITLGAAMVANVLVFIWLLGMMFTTKFLDGLDGLVSGIVTIGAIMIFFLSRQEQWFQPEVATLAIIFAGTCFGFLIWNWHPAKIFLGEGGSLFTGFILGVLAIISGGKIMTTLLVIGIPFLDVIRVVFIRWKRRKPLHVGDSEHLHFKLLNSGMSQKQAVLLMYAISFSFGITTLFLQSSEKLVAFAFLFVLMLLMAVYFQPGEKRRKLWQKKKY